MKAMRALKLSDENKAKCAELRAFAEQPANYYRLDDNGRPLGPPPGDSLNHSRVVDTYRVVYSVTAARGELLRHMSISIPQVLGKTTPYPHPVAVFTIASWLGFTGGVQEMDSIISPGEDWQIHRSEDPVCIVIVQPYVAQPTEAVGT